MFCALQAVHRYVGGHGTITALAVTPEDCNLGGCHDGCMLVFVPRTSAVQSKFNLGAAPMRDSQSEGSSLNA